jgi:hypothetical protein
MVRVVLKSKVADDVLDGAAEDAGVRRHIAGDP